MSHCIGGLSTIIVKMGKNVILMGNSKSKFSFAPIEKIDFFEFFFTGLLIMNGNVDWYQILGIFRSIKHFYLKKNLAKSQFSKKYLTKGDFDFFSHG